MTGQLGLDLRDAGAEAALERDEEWVAKARVFIQHRLPGVEFTADWIVHYCGLPRGSRNAVGGLLVSLQRQGLIEATGRQVRSTRLARRAGWIQVWRRV